MDSLRRSHLIRYLQAVSPVTSPGGTVVGSHVHSSSDTSFPIIAIAVIGILATAFLLVSYYIFAIKCCLNWHRIDLLRRFSLSIRRQESVVVYSPGTELRGLDEAVIRLIPVIQFKKEETRESVERSFCECAVCLNEFQQDEKLRMIPNCSHVFHIDCIDVWLKNNANCPLCRISISLSTQCTFQGKHILTPSPSPQQIGQYQHSDNLRGGDEDFVVIELGVTGGSGSNHQTHPENKERWMHPVSPSPRKSDQTFVQQQKSKNLHQLTSVDDECIHGRCKDEDFLIQPIRRSFSMDSCRDRQLYLSVHEALQQQNWQQVIEVSHSEGCSSRMRRSFCPFRNSNRSKSAVLPVSLDSYDGNIY